MAAASTVMRIIASIAMPLSTSACGEILYAGTAGTTRAILEVRDQFEPGPMPILDKSSSMGIASLDILDSNFNASGAQWLDNNSVLVWQIDAARQWNASVWIIGGARTAIPGAPRSGRPVGVIGDEILAEKYGMTASGNPERNPDLTAVNIHSGSEHSISIDGCQFQDLTQPTVSENYIVCASPRDGSLVAYDPRNGSAPDRLPVPFGVANQYILGVTADGKLAAGYRDGTVTWHNDDKWDDGVRFDGRATHLAGIPGTSLLAISLRDWMGYKTRVAVVDIRAHTTIFSTNYSDRINYSPFAVGSGSNVVALIEHNGTSSARVSFYKATNTALDLLGVVTVGPKSVPSIALDPSGHSALIFSGSYVALVKFLDIKS